ncbi:hypothetical protein [Gordonia hydrophobica]|uniref:Uncharacterized protein n=1 Tax=Gordonia hydrophobica TaxID=40516 RepID=A0ABZ2U696_9ACTN|nr:hypothetical protein [Gordonia hydrophobica]MBM7368007.1 hypothetical protein [Gordonia hydrophobica]
MSRSIVSRTAVLAVAAASVLGLVGCGGDESPALSLPNLLITADHLPTDFSAVPMTVDDLIAANRSTLEQARTVGFDPPSCAPTADAAFNPQLTDENTALVVGKSDTGTFSELVSTVRRDIDADRRATTGPCRVVTATPSTGALTGATIVTTSVELPAITDSVVEQAFWVRSDSVTTLASGAVRARSGLIANVLVKTAAGEVVTLQLGLSTDEREVSEAERKGVAPGAPLLAAPLSDEEFGQLVQTAVARAAQ